MDDWIVTALKFCSTASETANCALDVLDWSCAFLLTDSDATSANAMIAGHRIRGDLRQRGALVHAGLCVAPQVALYMWTSVFAKLVVMTFPVYL